MITLNQPPPVPDSTIGAALALLQIASDPAGTKSRLDEILAATTDLQAAYAEAVGARDAVVVEQKKLAGLEAAQAKLADDQAVLTEAQTQMQVAASALRDRETKIAAAEVAQAKERNDIAAQQKALAARISQFRQALA
jgi:hypothetical protein